ncbi:ubiquitin-conjugating enzyme [Grosmannia clavigera kw1407]|uniref:Ubiquitin-conjugating enzyme n=1 Tax=Grosmannia clavigera (strain kw1407 / UAMH 11150) TaxID=655863 RepID=F0XUT3_GROCL|nr:ubiquitin-conjugating enzyme [Grosmannia clavigera kw1407]EFW98401.1 ubiquitin-conjugating enzyme [Grosmannia clavigera kw1407]
MDLSRLTGLPSLRRQNLLAEFVGFRQACPAGVFVSLTPGDPALWTGVLFVRDGPYAPAILRFQIVFPERYPAQPPLITFATDIFHPLVTPLTMSAADDENLPPGGFSLRHGFPVWFSSQGAARRQSASLVQTPPRADAADAADAATASTSASIASTPSYMQTQPRADDVATYDVLRYIRSTFDDATVLDAIPLESAGNPGAWHAWRAHRRQSAPTTAPAREPGEWNWEHVWEERVKNGINVSVSDAVLYGGTVATDDVIHFLSMDDGDVEAIKANLKRTLDVTV